MISSENRESRMASPAGNIHRGRQIGILLRGAL